MAKLLDRYNAKRDFSKTPEPKGAPAAPGGNSFVIQKHAATRLHYDFRLELDGVLKSWAITRGPSLVPGEKRLAVHTEDHPLDYGTFEGTIPKGQYGGGTVLLWDRGTWEAEGDAHKDYAKGNLKFRLEGEKLGGAWHLVRMRQRPQDRNEQWLLIKSADEFARTPDAPDILEELPRSVATGRDLDEIASDKKSKVWQSNREEKVGAAAATPNSAAKAALKSSAAKTSAKAAAKGSKAPAKASPRGAKTPRQSPKTPRPKAMPWDAVKSGPMPEVIEPCLATLVDEAPAGDKWLHEIKWDGYRLIAFLENGEVRIQTRNGHDWTRRFPAVAEAIAPLEVRSAILDGEAIVEDENGHSSFSALQEALSDGGDARQAIFYAFDLLYLDGEDLRQRPLEERKARLAEVVRPEAQGALRLSEHMNIDGRAMLRHACQLGMEGVISKRRDLPYRSGRTGDWLKAKCTDRQEFVICGYTPSTALKNAVGSLVLGYYDDGRLMHAGRTGTGFTAELARDVYKRLSPLRVKDAPFDMKLNSLQRRGAVWIRPELVAEVEFRGWTHDDHIRHAAFKGVREDKSPSEIVRERPRGAVAVAAESTPIKAAKAERAERRPKAGATKALASKNSDEVAGVPLTHPDRVLWEEGGITKQGLAEYYEEIADWVLPHLVDRPLSLVRCPSGAGKSCFFQKHAWAGLAEFIKRKVVRDESGEEEILFIEDIQGLIALVQASVLEIHPWGSSLDDVDRPDRVVMDLDPGDGVAWPTIIEAAREARERLEALGLTSFVKTTGGKGLHVVFPLTPKAGWDEVKAFARDLAESMERDSPDRYVSTSTKRIRTGKIYVDYLRNGRGATAISAYSTRARPGAPVAVPLTWEELSPAIKPNHFTIENLPARLKRLREDPWRELFRLKQTLPAAAPKPAKRR